MGTSKTTAEFSGKLARMAGAVARIPRELEAPNARTAERVIGGAVSSMSGGNNHLSGAGSVGVNTTTTGSGSVAVSPSGPVHLVENPTRPHQIGADGTRLRIGGRWVTGPVFHRGTRGKHQWSRARDDKLPDPIRKNTTDAMTATTRSVYG